MTIVSRRLYAPLLSAVTCTCTTNSAAALSLSRPVLASRHWTFHPCIPWSSRSRHPSATRRRSMSSTDTTNDDEVPNPKKPLVQYIVLRRDLDWPPGAMAAQAAHASLAAVAQGLQHQHEPTQAYISPSQLPHMTKYVYGVDTLHELESVRDSWKEFGGEESYYWWVEQPENVPSAFATWPVERTNQVSKVIKSMKLTFF